MNKELIILSAKRAAWTFLEVVLSMITIGTAIQDINWLYIASIAATSTVAAFIKSILVGVPEAVKDGTLLIDDRDEEKTKWILSIDPDEVTDKKSIRLSVKKE